MLVGDGGGVHVALSAGGYMLLGIIIIVAMVLGFAGFVLLLVNKWIKNDHEIEKLKLQKETKELEIKLLEEENKKYDKIINAE
jgi:hypothetical protein